MAIIKVEEEVNKDTMVDVGEMVRDYGDDDCAPICETESKSKKMKKSYPNVYLYEAPDELFNALSVGAEYELTIKCKVKELTERVTDSEKDGKKEKRTIDIEIMEISKPNG